MSRKRNLSLTALLAVVLAAGLAWAADQDQREGPLPPGPPAQAPGLGPVGEVEPLDDLADDPGLREKLGITDAQAEQLRALVREAAKFRIRHHADMALKRMELEELLAAETPDRALIEKKLREISDLQYALLKSQTDSRLALQGVLTPEQRTKLRSLLRERMFWRGRGMRMRGMGMRGMRLRPHRRWAPMPPAPPQPPAPPEPPAT